MFCLVCSDAGEHELVEELFEQIKPGLSAYAGDPRKVKFLSRKSFLLS